MTDLAGENVQSVKEHGLNEILDDQHLMQKLFDTLPVAITVCSFPPDSRILYLNSSLTHLLGYTISDVSSIENLFNRKSDHYGLFYSQWSKIVNQLDQSHQHIKPEALRVVCKDGSLKEVLLSASRTDKFIVYSFTDITTSTRHEDRELDKIKDDYFLILENTPIAIACYRSTGNQEVFFVNKCFQDIFGYSCSEVGTASKWMQLLYPDPVYRQEVFQQWQDLISNQKKTGKSDHMQCKVVNNQGKELDVLFGAIDLGDQIIVTMQDLTMFRSAETELEEVRQALAKTALSITEAIPVGTYTMVKKPDQPLAYFSFMSERFLQLTGLERKEAESDPLKGFSCVHPDDFDDWVALNAEAFANKSPFYGETRVVINGEVRWITAESVPRDLPDGSTVWEGVLADITTRKKYEFQLKNANEKISLMNEQLEIRVMERTAELEEREHRLEKANQELVKASRLKDEFLAMMSHELRTPLNSILGMSEILQGEILGKLNIRQEKALNTIEESGQHLLSLINDILDVINIEAGKVNLDFQYVNVNSLCKSSLELISNQAREKQIQVKVSLPSQLTVLYVDENRIRQALLNLLNNAIKFTPRHGQVVLDVSYFPISEDQSIKYLRFSVKDTGIGITDENLEQLFKPFVQLDSALSRQYNGTGLGLVLVKKIVELHGGKVSVSSKVGVGSCFSIDLPIVLNEEELDYAFKILKIKTEPQALKELERNSRLILLAEDDPANVASVKTYLEAKGYRLLTAANGEEAFKLAESEKPNLIIMDIQMPKLNGLEAIQLIRTNPLLQDTPIVALTALAMEGDKEKCLEAGASEYLSKPVKLRYLWEVVEKLCQ